MKSVVSLLLALLFSLGAQAGVFVGNGGEGILTEDGRIELRDLYEAEIGEPTKLQVALDTRIVKQLNESAFLLQQPSLLEEVALRLSLIESREAMAGVFLAEFMVQHRWLPTRQSIKQPPLDDSPLEIPPERRVVLANRFQLTVRLSDAYWSQLSVAQKSALMVHEMVSAGFRLQCAGEVCSQPAPLVRELVAQIFAPANHLFYVEQLKVLEKLRTPVLESRLMCEDFGVGISLTRSNAQSESFVAGDASKVAASVCESSGRDIVQVNLNRHQFRVESSLYTTKATDGSQYQQSASEIVEYLPQRIMNDLNLAGFRNDQQCARKLNAHFERWFKYEAWTYAVVLTCSHRWAI